MNSVFASCPELRSNCNFEIMNAEKYTQRIFLKVDELQRMGHALLVDEVFPPFAGRLNSGKANLNSGQQIPLLGSLE